MNQIVIESRRKMKSEELSRILPSEKYQLILFGENSSGGVRAAYNVDSEIFENDIKHNFRNKLLQRKPKVLGIYKIN
jgi:hypothetical protein